jgi:FixJ family two-component response regulator
MTKAKELGAVGYIHKPIGRTKLLEKVAKLLSNLPVWDGIE